jgi:pimeloyl-ACP methyl ester carboxylesterase
MRDRPLQPSIARDGVDKIRLARGATKESSMKIVANGIGIYVEDEGSGDLPLVFLHYWGGSSRTWHHVTSALASSHRTIATDHRGWGRSDAPPSGYGLADLAADAEGVIEALGLERYILIGHSMGGKVAQLLASRRPNGLAGLVLVAPSPPSPMRMPAEARDRMANAYASREAVEATIDQVLTAKALSPRDRAQVIDDSLRGAPPAKAAWPQATSLEDITQEVSAIDVPTIVIAGAMDRVDSVAILQSELMPRIPQAVLHVLPGTGHLSMLESPELLVPIVSDFANALRIAPGAAD